MSFIERFHCTVYMFCYYMYICPVHVQMVVAVVVMAVSQTRGCGVYVSVRMSFSSGESWQGNVDKREGNSQESATHMYMYIHVYT